MQAQFGKDVLGVVRLDEAKAHNEQSKRIKESITPDKTFEEKQELKEAAKVESAQYKKLKNGFFTFSSGILIKEQTCTGQQQLDYEPRRACN